MEENQKTLLEIDIDVDQLNANGAAAKKTVQDLTDKLKILKATGKENTAEFVKTSGELKFYRAQVAEAVQVNNQLIKVQNDQTGSIKEMRTNLSLITREYNSLSAAERNNAEVGGRLLKTQKSLSDELKVLEKQGGNTSRNVGNYSEAIKDALANQIPFVGQLSSAAKGFNSMNTGLAVGASGFDKLKIAIAGTGIGLLIIAVAALINYLKTFDPLVDALEQGMAGLKAAFDVLGRTLTTVITSFSSVGAAIQNIGSFLRDPISSMKSFGKAMADAAVDAANLKAAQQDLEDSIRINEVKTAETQQRVAELILKARNRSLSNGERKKLLDEAAALDAGDFKRRTGLATEELRQANEAARIKGGLSKADQERLKRDGVEYAVALQSRGKLSDAEVEAIKKAQLSIISARQESVGRQEKIQNRIDADAEKAEAARQRQSDKAEAARKQAEEKAEAARVEAAKKRQDAFDQAAKESEQFYFDQSIKNKTKEEQEIEKIRRDYEQRIKERQKFNLDIKDLEEGRAIDEADVKQKYYLIARDNAKREADEDAAIKKDRAEKAAEFAKQEAEAIAQFEFQKRQTYRMGADLLASIAGKNTIVGKAAFLAQKAFAVGEIAINTQKEISLINVGAAAQAAGLSLIPFIGPGLAAAVLAKAKIESAFALARGIISAASVIGTAVAGYARGGIFKTRGRGGYVEGPGTGTSDSVNARLSNGEAVMTAEAVRRYGPQLSDINVMSGGRAFDSVNKTGSYASGGLFAGQNALLSGEASTQRLINETARAVADNIPRQILVIDEVQAKLNDRTYIANKQDI